MISMALLAAALLEPTKLPTRENSMSRGAVNTITHTLPRRQLLNALIGGTGALLAMEVNPSPVWAETSLATRQQAYSRYVPRVERGRDYWQNGLRKLVATQNWKEISAALEKKGSIDRMFGPMELWASSWSSKTISDKTIAMNGALDELREACRGLKVASEGKEGGGGFFGFGGPKVMDPSKRAQLAQAAYAKGVQAINKYLEIGNDGIGLQFAPIDLID
ncbi:hypothetical protein AB1Y20_006772 [Prymnesium parvum]|uniref:Uncharacterized protein n=1 Tax=Prymnesium parvum TaxID=97485 RepID=A0AB34IZT4_PRYPA